MSRNGKLPPFVIAVRKAVEIIGSQGKAAAATDIPQSTISDWVSGKTTKRFPYDAPAKFEKATGGQVKAAEFFG